MTKGEPAQQGGPRLSGTQPGQQARDRRIEPAQTGESAQPEDAPAQVRCDREGRVLRLLIDREDRHNPLSRDVLAQLSAFVREASADQDLCCIVVRGAGQRYFAAGGDLRDLDEVRTPDDTRVMSLAARDALDAFRQSPIPVLAMINGDAIGGGAELAVACDFRVIAAHAQVGFVHGRLNIGPAWGGGTDLCTLVGAARALRMMTRSELVPAQTALAWGLVDEVAQPQGLDEAVATFLAPLLRQTSRVIRAVTAQARACRNGWSVEQRRELELGHIVDTWSHPDHLAAVDRFFGRSPDTG